MKENLMMIVWIAMTVVFGFMEAATAQLVSIWFVIGSVTALGSYFFGASVTVQVIVFIIVSAVALLVTRPIVKKFTQPKIQAMNADSCIGLDAVVTESISNLHSKGAVRVKGVEWTARSANGEEISKDEIVTVKSIEGVKLIVERKIH